MIEFRNVSFSYGDVPVVENLSFTIRAPITSCPWKVHPVPASKRLLAGLPMS